ncbi:MAG: hypothetical protein VW122_09090 [Paracoccaceae bacterium]
MTKYFDPDLSPETLETYQGYSLQVFASGRSKLSFHRSHKDRAEYYAVRPKRFREAYRRQYDRSASSMPEHYRLIEQLLAEYPESLLYRVHRKGDSNATADHAHLIVLIEKRLLHVLLGTLHHRWELPVPVLNALLTARGPKRGSSAIFNEYMASYQHDWEDVTFFEQDYGKGYREPNAYSARLSRVHQDDDLDF